MGKATGGSVIFEQYYLECLSHASYLVGDESTGRAVVVDPQRDVDGYVADADAAGLTIERVIETHLHADFLSGHLELAARTGATISFGDAARVDFRIEPLHDGQRLVLGDVVLEVLATPGHTPESICIVVYEHADDPEPFGVLTGDTLFVGDVGRPDLLASSGSGLTADVLGRRLYHSLHDRLLRLPDSTRVFPAHGAGSSCGKQLSSERSSTLGEQRAFNYALAPMTEDEFVAVVTEGQPTRPHYFEFDASRNRQLRPLLDEEAPPEELSLDDVLARRDAGAALLDAREPVDFGAGHLRGAIDVGLQGRFAEWAGDVLDPGRDIVLVGDPATALETKVRLARIGFDRVVGQLRGASDVLAHRPDLVERSSRVTIEQLAELRGLEPDLQVVDIRNPGETSTGVLPGAHPIPLPNLVDALGGLDRTAPTVVYCASGYRSAVAASVLEASGFTDVSDLVGGYGAWSGAGLPTSAPTESPSEGAATMTVEVPEVDPVAGAALVDAGAQLLDVRELDEWAAGHAPTASHMPMREIPARVEELPRPPQRIVAICRSGGRSRAVAEALLGAGFDVVNVEGGMRAWQAAGLPIQTDDGAPGRIA
ncbi:MAG TPA: MBL fold metallo-hydrolase [Acidimicrobiia bacterium]|nr:MBL fold metallo-hydrolase [Acidimicrobiia bacterium]